MGGQDKAAGHLVSDSVFVGRVKKLADLVECSAPAPYTGRSLSPTHGSQLPLTTSLQIPSDQSSQLASIVMLWPPEELKLF